MGREVKRVALDFDWPLDGEPWKGYLMPDKYDEDPCPADCDHGYSQHAAWLRNRWYGNEHFDPAETGSPLLTPDTPEVQAFAERNVNRSPEYYGRGNWAIRHEAMRLCALWNGMWSHHLEQRDVDALITAGRLMNFTHAWSQDAGRWVPRDPAPVVTAAEVNRWSLGGFGHDSLNCGVVVEARCEADGRPYACSACGGYGSVEAYPGQRAEAEAWEPIEPPVGEGWQYWETVSEGSPISPVFATREGLVEWLCADYRWGSSGPLTRGQAESMVSAGWAPSGIIDASGVHAGDTVASG